MERVLVEGHTGNDEADAEEVLDGRDLVEDDEPDDCCCGRQEGEHQRESGAREPCHGELVGDVGITDEHTPTPIPHSSQRGWVKAGMAPERAAGVAAAAATIMAAPSWSMPLMDPRAGRVPSAAMLAMR